MTSGMRMSPKGTQTDQNHRKIRQIQAEQHPAVVRGILDHRSLVECLFLLLVRGIFPEFQPEANALSLISFSPAPPPGVTHRRLSSNSSVGFSSSAASSASKLSPSDTASVS